jgi:hypothetical protein
MYGTHQDRVTNLSRMSLVKSIKQESGMYMQKQGKKCGAWMRREHVKGDRCMKSNELFQSRIGDRPRRAQTQRETRNVKTSVMNKPARAEEKTKNIEHSLLPTVAPKPQLKLDMFVLQT